MQISDSHAKEEEFKQLAVLDIDGSSFRMFRNPSERVKREAVRMNPENIKYVDTPSREIVETAIIALSEAYVTDLPEDFVIDARTADAGMIGELFKYRKMLLKHLELRPEQIMHLCESVFFCFDDFIPHIRNMSMEDLEKIVAEHPYVLGYVQNLPSSVKKPLIVKYPCAMNYTRRIPKEVFRIIISESPEVLSTVYNLSRTSMMNLVAAMDEAGDRNIVHYLHDKLRAEIEELAE